MVFVFDLLFALGAVEVNFSLCLDLPKHPIPTTWHLRCYMRRLIAFDENDICDNREKITCQLKVAPQSLFIKLLGLLHLLLLPPVAHSHPGTDVWFPIFGQERERRGLFLLMRWHKDFCPQCQKFQPVLCLVPGRSLSIYSSHDRIFNHKHENKGVVKPVLDFQLQDKVGLAAATFAVFTDVVSGMGTREVDWLRCTRLLREQSNLPVLLSSLCLGTSVIVQSLSRVRLSETPWTAAHQAPLSSAISQSLLKFMSIELVMPSNHLILCYSLLLLPSIFPSIKVFSNESALCIKWPKYWSFSFCISPFNEYSELISFRIDWCDLLIWHLEQYSEVIFLAVI